ncbi:MAG TPA: geranylgeranylglycerol-phosphate geranylgeranyltransferase [Ignavibacteriaceae bacterium]|nr:geranylgeranylglycerol-phosphate geranylgeranyltransferase [Ignavibacteriaceae bacterium]
MTEKLTAIIKIVRPLNFLITFVSVFVAAVICSPDKFPGLNTFLAAIAASLVMASGNIINDIYDIGIDKINKPLRPIPSGSITIKEAYALYFIFIVTAIFISALVNEQALAIVLISILLLFFYTKYLKRISLVGNITVAFLTGLVFIFGGVVVENPAAAIVPAVFASLINLIREIVKDMEDVEGDTKAGVVTFPIKFGSRKSKLFISLITISLILFTLYPFIYQLYKIEYFVVVMILVNPLLVYCLKILFENHTIKSLTKISNLLKLNMLFGLIAIYLGV